MVPQESGKFLDVPVSRRTALTLAAGIGLGIVASNVVENPGRVASLIEARPHVLNTLRRASTVLFSRTNEPSTKPVETVEGLKYFPSGIGQIDFFDPEQSEEFLATVLGHENMNKFQELQAVGIIDAASGDDMKKFTDLYRANEDYAMVSGALQKLNRHGYGVEDAMKRVWWWMKHISETNKINILDFIKISFESLPDGRVMKVRTDVDSMIHAIHNDPRRGEIDLYSISFNIGETQMEVHDKIFDSISGKETLLDPVKVEYKGSYSRSDAAANLPEAVKLAQSVPDAVVNIAAGNENVDMRRFKEYIAREAPNLQFIGQAIFSSTGEVVPEEDVWGASMLFLNEAMDVWGESSQATGSTAAAMALTKKNGESPESRIDHFRKEFCERIVYQAPEIDPNTNQPIQGQMENVSTWLVNTEKLIAHAQSLTT